MSESEIPSQDLTSLENALRALVPRETSVNRDELLFQAGQESASHFSRTPGQRWSWPLSIAASSLVAATLGLIVGRHSEPSVVEHIVRVPVAAEVELVKSISPRENDSVQHRAGQP